VHPVEVEDAGLGTLEECLHRARDAFMLLGDVFALQVVAPDYLQTEMLSRPACQAAAALCQRQALEIRQLLDRLPVAITNWTPSAHGTRFRRE
jgi:hypothetical protein